MKRLNLIRHLEAQSCELLREGGNHSIYLHRTHRKCSAVGRHREIIEFVARKICKAPGVRPPDSTQ